MNTNAPVKSSYVSKATTKPTDVVTLTKEDICTALIEFARSRFGIADDIDFIVDYHEPGCDDYGTDGQGGYATLKHEVEECK